MPGPDDLTEPELSPTAQRVVAAMSVSIALHVALIGLVRVNPATMAAAANPVIQARLQITAPHPAAVSAPPPLPQSHAPLPAPVSAAPPATPSTSLPTAAEPEPPAPRELPSPNNPAPSSALELPAIDVPLLMDPTFYTARQVDVHPRALADIQPGYPELARSQGMTGRVMLQLKIDAAGTVQDLEVLKAHPPGIFDQSALDAFRNAHFTPAQKEGRAVNSLVEIEVRYELDP